MSDAYGIETPIAEATWEGTRRSELLITPLQSFNAQLPNRDGVLWADALMQHIGRKTPSESLPGHNNENQPSAVPLAFPLAHHLLCALQSSPRNSGGHLISTAADLIMTRRYPIASRNAR